MARSVRQHKPEYAGASSSCSPFVVLQQSAQRFMTDDSVRVESFDRRWRRKVSQDRHVPQTLVRSLKMIMDQPLLKDMP